MILFTVVAVVASSPDLIAVVTEPKEDYMPL